MTARALGLDRFLLSCLHNKSFTAEIAENLSVGRQLWWLGKDDNFQDIIGGLIYFTCGHRKQSLSTEHITKMRFSRSSQRSPQLLSRIIGITSHGLLLSEREKWGRINLELHFYLSLSQAVIEHKNITTQNSFDEERQKRGKIGGRVLWPLFIP